MRAYLPWLLILTAVVLGYYLLAGDEVAPRLPYEQDGDVASAPPGDPRAVELKGADAPPPGSKKNAPPKPIWQPADPRTLPQGVLIIQPRGPDLKPLVDRGMSILVTPRGQKATKLGLFDEETGNWRFERVIAGTVDIRVTGDHIVGRSLTAVVRAEQEVEFELHLEHAGAVKYDVITYAQTRPEQVLLELLDSTDRPTEGWFQDRTPRKLTQPRLGKSATLGPEGVVFGIRPGRYKLKVTSIESDEWDTQEVEVVAGSTAPVTLEIRR
ncbi:MAG: hypothetical protein O2894_12055 [Planctomycetota bacterium]|nr:hypothetical protein [Planctomycetota bacterium]